MEMQSKNFKLLLLAKFISYVKWNIAAFELEKIKNDFLSFMNFKINNITIEIYTLLFILLVLRNKISTIILSERDYFQCIFWNSFS